MAKKVDHTNTLCCICGAKTSTRKGIDFEGRNIYIWYTYIKDIYPPKQYVGNYICSRCRGYYYSNRLPDSYINVHKSLRNIRTGNLDKNSTTGKATIDQAVVCKVLKIDDLNIKNNNFDWYVDMENEKYGKIDVKGPSLSVFERGPFKYYYWHIDIKRKIDCNTIICLGHTLDRKIVECIWIIPNDEICESLNIKIWKTLKITKWDQFKVDPKPYNDTYQDLMKFLKDKTHFGINDIKRWGKMGNIII